MIQAGGMDFNDYFVFRIFRLRDFFNPELVQLAMLLNNRCFHQKYSD
jgi:hypothetical protein